MAGFRTNSPLSLASAARAGTHALLAVGRFDDAVNLGQTAADWLAERVDQDDPAALSIAGMLHLRTAIAAADRQGRSTTTTLLAAADRAATRLGRDADYCQTSFGPTNVQLHRVAAWLGRELPGGSVTSIGVVAASAGGVETLRGSLVEPLVDEGHQVAITLTPTAATWLDHLGEIHRLEALTGLPVRSTPRLPDETKPHPRATFSLGRR